MSGPSEADKPRIVVDEDWKSSVQAEKERLARGGQDGPTAHTAPQPAAQSAAGSPQAEQPPPANLGALLTLLAAQASAALAPQADGGQPGPPDLVGARFFIDLLQVLEDKTRGNRTPAEEQYLAGLLHELRMAFVAVKQGAQ